MASDSTGILDLRVRIPDLERKTQKARDTVSLIQSELEQLSEACLRMTTKYNEKSTEVQELDKEFVQLSNRLAGLEAKSQEIGTSRLRLNREKETLTQAQIKIGQEIQAPSQLLAEASESHRELQKQLTPLYQLLDGDKGSLARLREERHELINLRADLRVEVEHLPGSSPDQRRKLNDCRAKSRVWTVIVKLPPQVPNCWQVSQRLLTMISNKRCVKASDSKRS